MVNINRNTISQPSYQSREEKVLLLLLLKVEIILHDKDI